MKRIITALLLCCLLLSLWACAPSNSLSGTNNKSSQNLNDTNTQGTSYYKWVGKYELEKIELNGSVFYAKDFADTTGWNSNQYVQLNQDYTGELAVTSVPGPAFLYRIRYSYDIAHESGYIYPEDISESIRFQVTNDSLIFDLQGATWTFKKQ